MDKLMKKGLYLEKQTTNNVTRLKKIDSEVSFKEISRNTQGPPSRREFPRSPQKPLRKLKNYYELL